MKMYFLLIFFNFLFFTKNLNLLLTMDIVHVDDCVTSVYYQNNEKYRIKESIECAKNNQIYKNENPIVKLLYYNFNNIIDLYVKDYFGNEAALSMNVYLNEYIIRTESLNFWRCRNCNGDEGNYIYNADLNLYDCVGTFNAESKDFHFQFNIGSISDLKSSYGHGVYRFPYHFPDKKHIFIYAENFNAPINLINLNSKNFLYILDNYNQVIEPIYELLSFEITLDNYFPFSYFEILTLNGGNNEVILNYGSRYNIQTSKVLKYKLKEEERIVKGVHLKLKIKIYDFKNNPVTELDKEEFNFYICLKGYKICDANTYMKCLNEGYFFKNNLYYSCYETCQTCDKKGKPPTSNYINNYCDLCKTEFPYFVNITDNENDFYKSCYRQCPKHAPYLKEANSFECLSQCPKYKTIDKVCVGNCDYEVYKYLLKENATCFNYIPDNYSLYIDNHIELYDNSSIPLNNIINKCPNGFDSSFKNYCINSTDDIYYLIPNPNELIDYHDPLIIPLKTKNITIRAYSSDSKRYELKYYDNKLFKIDISHCEKLLKEYYGLSQEESIIIYDVNNVDNDNYLYKIFSSKGEELSLDICKLNNVSTKIINYYSKKGLNRAKCPKEYPYYNTINDKCIKYCDIDDFLSKTCLTDNINNENKEKNIKYIKDSMKYYFISPFLDNITNLGEDIIIEEEGIKYHLTSTSNQNDKIYQNISSIYLGKCENKLKEKYKINSNQSLLIFKVDIDIEGYLAPVVEYEVYHPITKEKLDLSYCDKDQIKISLPVSKDINENDIIKYDPKSEFYNDICSIFTSKFNTDITLKDRQNEFINNNISLCEDSCDFISYDFSLKKVDCECNIKLSIKDLYKIKINKEQLKSKFDFKKMINIEVVKCYKKLFCKEGILYNIGSYILLSIILFFIIGLIIFINKEFISLQKEIELYINNDISNVNNINSVDKDISNLGKKKIIKRIVKKIKIKKKVKKGQEKENNDITIPSKDRMILNIIDKNKKNFDIKNNNSKNNNINININNIITDNENKDNNDIHDNIVIKKEKIIIMNDYELNESEYKDAIKYDKRNYFNYFCSLLKINHILLFAIIPSKDYNSKIIKICLFLFSFSLNLTIEALFYNEETIHDIYEFKGVYDIISQIPEIIYSSIISSFIDIIIKYFALSQKYVIEQKNKKSNESNEFKYKRIINNLYKKFLFFFIFGFLFLLFFWYYVSCFCAVFKNTQIHLIKDVLIGFAFSLIYPFISYLLSGIFRIFALRYEKEYIYKFSNLIVI